jgi:hypothetical protein
MAGAKLPPQRQFVAFSWLSPASCTSAEIASVLPTNDILVSSFVFVKILFITMLSFGLYELLWLRQVWIHAGQESFLLGRRVCLLV